ncbi:rhamnogalacturonan lyase [Asticcacaulis sp. 201]|uniref:rhamnogalacturonan lyase n=1 Tax=Asticcacaulis sp. 201 TaxID=3028787 RepID=UPI0029166DE9|nr:rhamnogalacturonan lyase [Asticcacaulis sp. 201]MDV6332980.1 rhamnogalacturonan lyase [Asticcacaulis sp. 201]
MSRIRNLLLTAALLPLAGASMTGASLAETPARHLEKLDRGTVAVKGADGVLVSWRILADDADGTAFNLYRDGKKVNGKPIAGVSNYLDRTGTPASTYTVRTIVKGKESTPSPVAKVWADGYLSIPLDIPTGGVTPDGAPYTYTANDATVGDLDGDGRYEIILKWEPTNAHDNSQGGYTGRVYFDAYTLEGKRLWRINMGPNIRAGAHYSQFQVADYDGDGKAEMIVKTADGTIDGLGKVVGDAKANWVSSGGELEQGDRTGSVKTADGKLMAQLQGRILQGPEYLSVFNGQTGAVMDTVPYWPSRVPEGNNPTPDRMKEVWGDGYGNRSERYLAGTAWLDGVHPSAVMARGYYGRTTLAAYDFRNGKLTRRWTFDSTAPGMRDGYSGQGNHQLSIADVDADGKDEVIYGSMAVDDDGIPLWTAKLFHGDAMHVGDLDPTRPGLEKFGVHEDMKRNGYIGSALLDARTGEVIWKKAAEKDTGRGLSADIDPRYPGDEVWGSNSPQLFNIKGEAIAERAPRQTNFAIWWDGDLLRELLDGNTISKWDWTTSQTRPLLVAEGMMSNNGTKSTPTLSADILGDWREEVILRSADSSELRVYSTPIPTTYGFVTLMQDPQYRASITWQNTAYNQPPHTGFYLGEGMKTPKKPNIVIGN